MHHPRPASCPLCSAKDELTYLESYSDPGRESYDLFDCKVCGVWFWNPLKNPGSEWYEHDERYAGRNENPILEPTRNHERTISFLGSKKGRVLDIGCGVGNFLAHASRNGWDCYGIDFDADAIAAGKRTFGLEQLEVADLRAFTTRHPGLTFDLITAFDVLEHIDNHNEFIELIRSLLAANGHIAMTVPYRKRALWLMPGDVPPRHLTRWDRTSLTRFLEDRGFRVQKIERQNEGIRPILMKLRFKYGTRFNFGLVSAVKSSVKKRNGQVPKGFAKTKIRTALFIARAKDLLLFGIPAVVIWLWMLFGAERYITLFVIAELESPSPDHTG